MYNGITLLNTGNTVNLTIHHYMLKRETHLSTTHVCATGSDPNLGQIPQLLQHFPSLPLFPSTAPSDLNEKKKNLKLF